MNLMFLTSSPSILLMRKKYKNEDYKRLINSGSKWKKIRDAKIKLNPLCECCGEKLAEEVHHILPLEDYSNDPETMEQLAYSPGNLQSLCRECHYKIHRELKRERYLNKDKKIENTHQRTEDFMNRFFGEEDINI